MGFFNNKSIESLTLFNNTIKDIIETKEKNEEEQTPPILFLLKKQKKPKR
jgi:hypothetical protein